jgi:hypothetical protein
VETTEPLLLLSHCSTGVTTPTPLGPIRFTSVSEQNFSPNQRSFSMNMWLTRTQDNINQTMALYTMMLIRFPFYQLENHATHKSARHLLASRYQNLPKIVNCYSVLGLNNDPHKNRDALLLQKA